MQITNEASKYQLVKYSFCQDAVADSQTAAQMNTVEVASGAALTNTGYRIPFPFEVVAVASNFDTPVTAGSLKFDPSIDGTAILCTVASTSVAAVSLGTTITQVRSSDRGAAGSVLGVQLTSASLTPTTIDAQVDVYCLLNISGV